MKIYIIAGEPSGDLLASGLMRALRRLVPGGVEFRGVGGESMEAVSVDSEGVGVTAGWDARSFRSLFDISEISVMGIFEVLPRLPLILRRIRQTIKDIESFAPDVLVTVDSWGFVSAVLSRLLKRQRRVSTKNNSLRPPAPVIHYVAPQVWAWKKGRAKNVARLVDRLMTLLPDEWRYFEKYGLQCDFVGHPVVERIAEAEVAGLDPEGFRAAHGIPPSVGVAGASGARVISVLPGSRRTEVKRLLPIFKDAVRRMAEKYDGLFVVVSTVAGVERQVRAGFEDFDIPTHVVTGEVDRYNAFAISDMALAKSGTVSLELVALGVPHLIAYTFGRLSNFAAKVLVKVRFANLINLIAGREIIPEFVLGRCRADLIAECASGLLGSRPGLAEGVGAAAKQVADAQEVLQRLRLPDILPSDRAAQIVVEAINEINRNN